MKKVSVAVILDSVSPRLACSPCPFLKVPQKIKMRMKARSPILYMYITWTYGVFLLKLVPLDILWII